MFRIEKKKCSRLWIYHHWVAFPRLATRWQLVTLTFTLCDILCLHSWRSWVLPCILAATILFYFLIFLEHAFLCVMPVWCSSELIHVTFPTAFSLTYGTSSQKLNLADSQEIPRTASMWLILGGWSSTSGSGMLEGGFDALLFKFFGFSFFNSRHFCCSPAFPRQTYCTTPWPRQVSNHKLVKSRCV